MYFEPNPVAVRVKAEIAKGRICFGNDFQRVRFSTDRKGPAPKLRITRGFRQNGAEFDPRFWELRGREPYDCDEDGAFQFDLVFRGRALTNYLGRIAADAKRDFARQRRTEGARSLYQAFVAQERIQLYVEELDARTEEPIPKASLGALLIELNYVGSR
jgi:hypothetical protein